MAKGKIIHYEAVVWYDHTVGVGEVSSNLHTALSLDKRNLGVLSVPASE